MADSVFRTTINNFFSLPLMKCLIIAAGKGSRLRQRGDSKPLIPLLGVPLIERVIRSAIEAGIDDFHVVTGYHGERVRDFLDCLSSNLKISITHIINEDWEKENGLSVLKAREYLHEPFLLIMADHLFDPAIALKLMSLSLDDGEIALAVDGDIQNPLVNMEDVTRVKTNGERICNIGKGIADFNGFDTGIFLCSPAIFRALDLSAKKHNDTTLSGAGRILATESRFKTVKINGLLWIDVDDPASFTQAENALLSNLRNKPNDGFVSRYFNRPLSLKISRHLVNLPITPNIISFFSFLLSLSGAFFFFLGGYTNLVAGGILTQISSVIDGCDGEVARLKYKSTDFGGWFDAVLDRYADGFLLFGLTYYVCVSNDSFVLAFFVGFLALIGTFMNSYTADKYDGLMRKKLGYGEFYFRMGRDIRMFIIFLGALTNLPLFTLAMIALITNIENIRRVYVLYKNG